MTDRHGNKKDQGVAAGELGEWKENNNKKHTHTHIGGRRRRRHGGSKKVG